MKTETIQIVDLGRGPQIAGHRLTVLDVFYYINRGRDFDFIRRALPSLSRDEFDAVLEYAHEHHGELVEKDRLAEEFIQRGIAEQKAKGLYRQIDDSIPVAVRATRLKESVRKRLAEQQSGNAAR